VHADKPSQKYKPVHLLSSFYSNCPNKKAADQLTLHQTLMQKSPTISEADKKKIKEGCVDLVCCDLRPFSALEGMGLRRLGQVLLDIGATYNRVSIDGILPSPNTVKEAVLKLADEASESLTAKLNGLPERGRVAATTDLWTDKYKNNSYLDLTVFFVDDSDQLHHQIVRCGLFVEERKTAANIRAVLVQWFNDVGISENVITSKLLPVTTDLGANFVAAFKDAKRMDCIDHRMSTVEKTSWETLESGSVEAAKFRKASHSLVEFSKRAGLKGLKSSLKSEVKTRWNSFYTLLVSIHENWDCLQQILSKRPKDYCRNSKISTSANSK
jgi:hypothetical protein